MHPSDGEITIFLVPLDEMNGISPHLSTNYNKNSRNQKFLTKTCSLVLFIPFHRFCLCIYLRLLKRWCHSSRFDICKAVVLLSVVIPRLKPVWFSVVVDTVIKSTVCYTGRNFWGVIGFSFVNNILWDCLFLKWWIVGDFDKY